MGTSSVKSYMLFHPLSGLYTSKGKRTKMADCIRPQDHHCFVWVVVHAERIRPGGLYIGTGRFSVWICTDWNSGDGLGLTKNDGRRSLFDGLARPARTETMTTIGTGPAVVQECTNSATPSTLRGRCRVSGYPC